jgi:hypothetical protein
MVEIESVINDKNRIVGSVIGMMISLSYRLKGFMIRRNKL